MGAIVVSARSDLGKGQTEPAGTDKENKTSKAVELNTKQDQFNLKECSLVEGDKDASHPGHPLQPHRLAAQSDNRPMSDTALSQPESDDGKPSQNKRRAPFAPADVDVTIDTAELLAKLERKGPLSPEEVTEAIAFFKANPEQLSVFDKSLGIMQRLEALEALLVAAEVRSQNIASVMEEVLQASPNDSQIAGESSQASPGIGEKVQRGSALSNPEIDAIKNAMATAV